MLKSTIRKEVGLVKTIRNKLYNTRKDIDVFKINSQNCKKKRVKVTSKKVNVRFSILELNRVININKNEIRKYTARNERLKREIERNNNEIRKCIARNEKCMDDLNKLANSSNAEKTSVNNDNTKVQVNEDNSKLKVNNTKVQAHNDKVKVDKVHVNNDKVQVNNDNSKLKVNNTNAQVNNVNTKVLVNNDKVQVNNDNTKPKAHKNKAQVNKDKLIIIKKNKVVDQVNLIAKIRTDYLKNINEISEIINDLHDGPQLRHIELNTIYVLTNKSLDHASELSHGGNREWYDVINNIDTINDKIDLVNEIGEVIDSYMADAYNIVDGINKSHNNDSLYDILAEDLKKCKDKILKSIDSFNVLAKNDKHIDRLSKINLLQDRKIFNHMRMILKKVLYEQITCDKFITTRSNKHVTDYTAVT